MDIIKKIDAKFGIETRMGLINKICDYIHIPCKCSWCFYEIKDENKEIRCDRCDEEICLNCSEEDEYYYEVCGECKGYLLENI